MTDPSPTPAQVAAAEAELPDEIEAAIEAFDKVVSGRTKLHQRAGGPTRDYDIADAAYDAAHAALTATILARLTAAETAREALKVEIRDQAIKQLASDAGWELDWDRVRAERDAWKDQAENWQATAQAEAEIGNERRAEADAALARAEKAEKALEEIQAREVEKAEQIATAQAEQNIAYLQANIAQMERFMERGEERDPVGYMQWRSLRDEFRRELDAALAQPAPAEET